VRCAREGKNQEEGRPWLQVKGETQKKKKKDHLKLTLSANEEGETGIKLEWPKWKVQEKFGSVQKKKFVAVYIEEKLEHAH